MYFFQYFFKQQHLKYVVFKNNEILNGTVYPTVYNVGFLMKIHIEDWEEFRRCGGWW